MSTLVKVEFTDLCWRSSCIIYLCRVASDVWDICTV